MELNEKTIKVGDSLYYLNILQDKDYGVWHVNINKAKITHFELERGGQYYFVKFKIPWANQLTSLNEHQYQYKQGQLWNFNLVGNNKPTVKLKEYKGTYQNEYEFFCDSFKDLTKILKETVFNGKGNEATKRKRLKLYRELLKQWTQSWCRENFHARLQ
jgi:hypothetical protein